MIRTMFASALALAIATPSLAQDFPPMPAMGAPRPFHLPAEQNYTLANGMKVTLVPYGTVPKVTISLRVLAGNLNEGDKVWTAGLSAAMLKEGAGKLAGKAIARAAASMGGDLDVSSDTAQTAIGLSVLSDRAADAVSLIGDVAVRPTFPAAAFERVKADLARSYKDMLSQAQPMADIALARAYYGPGHPYGRPIPTLAQLQGYTLADAKAFHDANFGAARAHLYVVGQFDPIAVKAAIEKAFGGWAPGPAPLSLPPQPKPGPQLILVDRPGAPQSTIRVVFPVPPATNGNDIQLRVANALLGGAFSSRITTNIRENKGYTYSPHAGITYHPTDAFWVEEADVTSAATGASLHEIFGEIRRMQTTLPTDAEANGMRTYLAGIFTLRNATNGGVAAQLATRNYLGLPADWTDRYVPAVLAVTPAQMEEQSNLFDIGKATVVVVGDLKTVVPQLKAQSEFANVPTQTVVVP